MNEKLSKSIRYSISWPLTCCTRLSRPLPRCNAVPPPGATPFSLVTSPIQARLVASDSEWHRDTLVCSAPWMAVDGMRTAQRPRGSSVYGLSVRVTGYFRYGNGKS